VAFDHADSIAERAALHFAAADEICADFERSGDGILSGVVLAGSWEGG